MSKQTINTLPGADANFLSNLQSFLTEEFAERMQLFFPSLSGTLSGGQGATDASLTHTISACISCPEGYYVSQASVSHTYTASKDTFVFIRDDDARVVTISEDFTITYDGHFVFAEAANATDQPSTPTGCTPLMEVVTNGTSITTVTDLRVDVQVDLTASKLSQLDDNTFDTAVTINAALTVNDAVTLNNPVTINDPDSSGSADPLTILIPSLQDAQSARIYFGKEKSDYNCVVMRYYHVTDDDQENNRVYFGVYGEDSVLGINGYRHIGINTAPSGSGGPTLRVDGEVSLYDGLTVGAQRTAGVNNYLNIDTVSGQNTGIQFRENATMNWLLSSEASGDFLIKEYDGGTYPTWFQFDLSEDEIVVEKDIAASGRIDADGVITSAGTITAKAEVKINASSDTNEGGQLRLVGYGSFEDILLDMSSENVRLFKSLASDYEFQIFNSGAGDCNVTIDGDLDVSSGTVSKGGGSFKIDHPLHPDTMYLYHSFVESPDMMNVYNGNVILDAGGKATITLPDYFQALNKDYKYQLTCIGGYAPVYIASEVAANKFSIAGGTPGLKVSWQVTGIRQDAFALEHPIIPEVPKAQDEIGLYLHPTALGLDASQSIAKHRHDVSEKLAKMQAADLKDAQVKAKKEAAASERADELAAWNAAKQAEDEAEAAAKAAEASQTKGQPKQ